MEISSKYSPREVEEKRLKFWDEKKPFHARRENGSKKKPYTIVIPPPNVTGVLHMGHALNNTLQDILIRYKRMQGYDALWMPGTDHAGIATQNVVEKQLAKEGTTRQELGREKFMERLWEWKKHHGDTIINQLHKLGSSCDWDRTRFTMDDDYSDSVKEVFVELYKKGLIYQGQYIINWCPRCLTALSDEEAEHKDSAGKLWHLNYPLKDDPKEFITVATTRPETMLGDTAVAVNPQDVRYKDLVGKTILLPLVDREIPIIADDFVDREFGSGAVKVTPAHDPNDFGMGQRHSLPSINIMHPNGTLNENAGAFKDMDRFVGRKAVVKAMDELGLLIKIDEHAHAVRECYRCNTIVEPYLSKQWFVKMKPLADRALKAFKEGKPVIQPKRWEKVYENWLTDIRDWCISRQIWWGHRIPVWYDTDGEAYVAKSEEEAQAQANKKHGKEVALTQEEDVLDTWFSSWLWPFATLGWPKNDDDVKYFYPTATLFTAPEIIFFWVARMVMAGLEFMGEVPFNDVVLHGTVRDDKGRKMSKSLGNALDPLEIINEYGADALRFSMILNSGQDIYISKDKFEIGRNFCNKLWNATRFLLMNIKDTAKADNIDDIHIAQLDLPSQWVLSCYNETLTQVSQAIDQFKYSEAENLLYEFFWGTYCDWYLEMIKGIEQTLETQKVAFYVLENTLKMLHPFIPFVTEEIASQIRGKERLLTLEDWPVSEVRFDNPKISKDITRITELITSIRMARAEWNVKPQEETDALIITKSSSALQVIQDNQEMLKRMCRFKGLTISTDTAPLKKAATGVIGDINFYIPLGDVIDLDKEKSRIEGQILQLQKNLKSLEGRLSNETFVSKAPVDVVKKEKARLVEFKDAIEKLTKVLVNIA